MIETVYLENSIRFLPRTKKILERLKPKKVIPCEHYAEVFNPKNQNFRLQKQNPALILAKKTGNSVLKTPEGFGIGSQNNYYFSHMLNCIYDCRYCFLQGMYRSANYLLFVNYEDFMSEIHSTAKEHEKLGENSYFFSGYDCDSMALDSITGFLEEFLPFFEQNPKAFLELRTKSIAIKQLLNRKPFENCVVAFSLSPDSISKAVEYKVPPLKNRIQALKQLANAGWKIGLRFDPLIYANNFNELYQELFEMVFANLPNSQLHSISLGPLRFPKAMFDRVQKLYPKEKLFAFPMEKRLGSYSYPQEIEENMTISIKEMLSKYADQEKFFKCSPL